MPDLQAVYLEVKLKVSTPEMSEIISHVERPGSLVVKLHSLDCDVPYLSQPGDFHRTSFVFSLPSFSGSSTLQMSKMSQKLLIKKLWHVHYVKVKPRSVCKLYWTDWVITLGKLWLRR